MVAISLILAAALLAVADATQKHPKTLSRRENTASLSTSQDTVAMVDITVGGQTISVAVDTGSSDFFISAQGLRTFSAGGGSTVTYVDGRGTITGGVRFGDMSFLDNFLAAQQYIQLDDLMDFNTNFIGGNFDGLLGIGPPSASALLESSAGNSIALLENLFNQTSFLQNFVTLTFQRVEDPESVPGQLTISQAIPGMESIFQQPKLPVIMIPGIAGESAPPQGWIIETDESGLFDDHLGRFDLNSNVTDIIFTGNFGFIVRLDSNIALSQVPQSLAQQMYGTRSGAFLENTMLGEIWTMPCTTEITLHFRFQEVSMPLHPLDVVIPGPEFARLPPKDGVAQCYGAFQPFESGANSVGDADFILGLNFLRNVHTLLDYGTFIDGDVQDRNDPFVQLLPLTNVSQAHDDFQRVRNGITHVGTSVIFATTTSAGAQPPPNTAQPPSDTNLPASGGLGGLNSTDPEVPPIDTAAGGADAPISTASVEDNEDSTRLGLSNKRAVIGGAVSAVLVLLGGLLIAFVVWRRGNRRRNSKRGIRVDMDAAFDPLQLSQVEPKPLAHPTRGANQAAPTGTFSHYEPSGDDEKVPLNAGDPFRD